MNPQNVCVEGVFRGKTKRSGEDPYISGEHAVLSGYSKWCPSFSIRSSVGGSRAGYGVLPTVKISQHVTPYDHCITEVDKCVRVSDNRGFISHHITQFRKEAIFKALWRHPFVGDLDSLIVFSHVACAVDILRQTKVTNFYTTTIV